MKVKYPNVYVPLVGCDGNAFAIIGRTCEALRRANVNPTDIDAFAGEARSGDYDHMLRTVIRWVETVDPPTGEHPTVAAIHAALLSLEDSGYAVTSADFEAAKDAPTCRCCIDLEHEGRYVVAAGGAGTATTAEWIEDGCGYLTWAGNAEEVMSVFQAHGFTTNWDGDSDSCIAVETSNPPPVDRCVCGETPNDCCCSECGSCGEREEDCRCTRCDTCYEVNYYCDCEDAEC